MSEYLLVVQGLTASGADVAMCVTESIYHAAMYGCAFSEPVYGYVWCDKHHDWVRCDEAMICQRCLEDILMREEALIDEEFEAGFGAQIDSMQDAGASWIEIVDALGSEDVDRGQAMMMYDRSW